VTDWRVWWSFNRDPYLRLREAVLAGDSRTGDDEFFLGFGQRRQSGHGRPADTQLRDVVVPALLRRLEGSQNQDLVTACLVALAKIGIDPAEGPLEPRLAAFLSASNQEIAETAAVSLGILGRESSAPLLAALLDDTHAGRRRVGRDEVPYRTRSFAAYGLGLLAAGSERGDVRSFAVYHLAQALEKDTTATRDLATACTISLGLVPLEVHGEWPVPETELRVASTRQHQVAWLLQWFEETDQSDAVRLHSPVALARLCAGAGSEAKRAVCEALLERTAQHSSTNREVQRAALIALGRLGDDDMDELDGRIRAKLRKAFASGDAMSRDLARIALARVATRPGSGPDPGAALESVRHWLLKDLATGRSTARAWTALGLGVLAYRRVEQGLEVSPAIGIALRERLRSTRSPRDAGALCTALGLAQDAESAELLAGRLSDGSAVEVQAMAAVALGRIGDLGSVETLQELARKSTAQPVLLRELATGLALMRDGSVLPDLIAALREARTLASQSALAFSVGRVGDARAVDPLLGLLEEEGVSEATRAFAAAALGVVGDRRTLPWNSPIAVDLHYGMPPASLTDGRRGVLDLL